MEGGLVSPRTEGHAARRAALAAASATSCSMSWTRSWSGAGTASSATPTTATCTCSRRRRASGCWHRWKRFLAKRLRLKVNRDKSAVARPWKRKFLGLHRHARPKRPKLKVAPQSVKRLKDEAPSRSSARGGADASPTTIAGRSTRILRGWVRRTFGWSEVKASLRGSGRVAAPEAALHRVAAVEAATNTGTGNFDTPRHLDAARATATAYQRPWAVVERRRQPHESQAVPDGRAAASSGS